MTLRQLLDNCVHLETLDYANLDLQVFTSNDQCMTEDVSSVVIGKVHRYDDGAINSSELEIDDDYIKINTNY